MIFTKFTKHLLRSAIMVVALSLAVWATSADAQTKKKKKKIVYEKETTIRFDESVVEGRIIKPDGFFLLRKRPKRWQDLIDVRKDFKPELSNMKYEL